MLFKQFHIRLIQQGQKTETRRVKKPRVYIGKSYPIRTNWFEKQRHGHIEVLAVRKERLGNLTRAAARCEGYPSREAYFKTFKVINRRLDLRKSIWVVRFRYHRRRPKERNRKL